MDKLTEITRERNSEFTIIGKFTPEPKGEYIDIDVAVIDYSSDGTDTEFRLIYIDGTDFSKEFPEHTHYFMPITSQTHGVAVMFNLIGAFGKIDKEWLSSHGWELEEEETND